MDDDLPPLPPLPFGDAAGPPADADALRGILRRHRRRQLASAALALAVVLVAGGAAGFAVGNSGNGSPRGTQVAAGAPAGPSANGSATNGSPANGPSANGAPVAGTRSAEAPSVSVSSGGSAGVAIGTVTRPITLPTFTQLLVRDAADGVRVRLYQEDITPPRLRCPAGAACPQVAVLPCGPTSVLTAEVSDSLVAGEVGGPDWSSTTDVPLQLVSLGIVGGGQPQPILVVIAQAQPAVAEVTLTTPFGADKQSPTNGWVALAVQLPADFNTSNGLGSSTLVATDASGKTLVSQGLDQRHNLPPACMPCAALGAPSPAPNSAPIAKAGAAPLPTLPCPLPCPPTRSSTGSNTGSNTGTGTGSGTGRSTGSNAPGAAPTIAMCVPPGATGGGSGEAGSASGSASTGSASGSASTGSASVTPGSVSSGPATVANP